MTKKLYYDCAIESAYMAKNFEVMYICLDETNQRKNCTQYIEEYVLCLNHPDEKKPMGGILYKPRYFPAYKEPSADDKFHIHPDSLHIFKPQVGDIGHLHDKSTVCVIHQGHIDIYDDIKISQRNNKPFITPLEQKD